jgi:hypothetical protein
MPARNFFMSLFARNYAYIDVGVHCIQFQLAKLHLSLPKALPAELAFVCGKIMDKTREELKALDKRQYVVVKESEL